MQDAAQHVHGEVRRVDVADIEPQHQKWWAVGLLTHPDLQRRRRGTIRDLVGQVLVAVGPGDLENPSRQGVRLYRRVERGAERAPDLRLDPRRNRRADRLERDLGRDRGLAPAFRLTSGLKRLVRLGADGVGLKLAVERGRRFVAAIGEFVAQSPGRRRQSLEIGVDDEVGRLERAARVRRHHRVDRPS